MHERIARAGSALAARCRPVAVAAALAVAAGSALAAGPAAAAVSPASVSTASAGGASGELGSISCASAGNCTAVGELAPTSPKALFTVSEKHGVWGTAQAVPGLAALLGRKPVEARFAALSCSSAGNCGAAGFYSPSAKVTRAFVVSEKNGTWGKVKQLPDPAGAVSSFAQIESLSCSSAGNCGAGGSYTPNGKVTFHNTGAFVASEKNGVWGKARAVPGLAKLNTIHQAGVTQLTCTSAGNCLAAGTYAGAQGAEVFTVTENHGTWGSARTFPRLIALATAGDSGFTSLSCKSPGNCTVVGFYYFISDQDVVFAFSEKNGVWGPITPIPGLAALQPGGLGQVDISSLTCLSQGNCTAGGDFGDSGDPELSQPFVVTETHGTWGDAQVIPGVAALSGDSMIAFIAGVQCRSAGNCSAAGNAGAAFVSTEKQGVWGKAVKLGGVAGPASMLSCGATGDCGLAGTFNAGGVLKPYLATQKNGAWGKAREVKGIEP